jgi:hypothetical protein
MTGSPGKLKAASHRHALERALVEGGDRGEPVGSARVR